MKKKSDWRTLPRKPADQVRSVRQGFRFTVAEMAAIRANAKAANQTVADYVVARCSAGR